MKTTLKQVGRGIMIMIVLTSFISARCSAADMNVSIRDFLAKSFPNNRFIATAYGADSRYSVRTIWAQLDNVQKTANSPDKTKAWVAFSDGLSIYPDSAVKVRQEAIDVRQWQLDKNTKWALAASLSGKLESIPADVSLDFGHTNDLAVEIDFGDVEIEFAYYADLLLSQKIYQQNLDALVALVKGKNSEIPSLRVIASALRVKNASITVKNNSGSMAGIDGKIGQFLTNFGLHYNAQKDVYESFHTDGWKYIAFEALMADKATGKISTAKDVPTDIAVSVSQNSQLLATQLGLDQ